MCEKLRNNIYMVYLIIYVFRLYDIHIFKIEREILNFYFMKVYYIIRKYIFIFICY